MSNQKPCLPGQTHSWRAVNGSPFRCAHCKNEIIPAMAAELTDAQLDEVTAGYERPVSVLAGVTGVVSSVTSGTTSSTASVTVTE